MNKLYPCINILIPFFIRLGTLHTNANVYFHGVKKNKLPRMIAMLITSYTLFFLTLIRCFCNFFPASAGAGRGQTALGIAVFLKPAGFGRLIELQTIFTHLIADLNNRIAEKPTASLLSFSLGKGRFCIHNTKMNIFL